MTSTDETLIGQHPLDGCDPDECYRTMMTERTTLISARREAEDTFVKTIMQLSVALIVVLAGFITQSKVFISDAIKFWLPISIVAFSLAILFGLIENLCSSRAYTAQQKLLEDYYGRRIKEFSNPRANVYVRFAQLLTFAAFIVAVGGLSYIAFSQTLEKARDQQATKIITAAEDVSTGKTIAPR